MMMQPLEFAVRVAHFEDVDDILGVIRRVYHEYGFAFEATEETPDLLDFDRTYDQQTGIFFVGVVSDRVVGTIGVRWVEATVVEILRLYLDAAYRGQGLGRRLLKAAIGWARHQQAQQVSLWTDTRFITAHKLYTRTSFVRGGVRHLKDVNNSVEYQFMLTL